MKRKCCPTCRRLRAVSQFYRSTKNKDGLQYSCKDCDKERGRKRREANRGQGPTQQKLDAYVGRSTWQETRLLYGKFL